MDRYLQTNQSLWNHWTRIHEKAAFYDVQGFKAGQSSLTPIELGELGDVAGKSLLHLQCHFGMDTLSWARLGAEVVGVDFSEAAIELARSLGEQTGIPARFVHSNIYDLPDVLRGTFDVVFTSYGVLNWLPDIAKWAKVAAHYLRTGGTFYMVEFHPFAYLVDEDGERLRHPYFYRADPDRVQEQGSYADPEVDFSHPAFFWNHSLGDIVNALIAAGLRIEFLHEFPFSTYNCFPFVQEREPGRWWPKAEIPLMFSVRASR